MTQLVDSPSAGDQSPSIDIHRESLAAAVERLSGGGPVAVVVGQCTSAGLDTLRPELGRYNEGEVHWAPSVQAAWHMIRDLRPDLIVLNVDAVHQSCFGSQLIHQLETEFGRGTRIAWCR